MTDAGSAREEATLQPGGAEAFSQGAGTVKWQSGPLVNFTVKRLPT
jgi:hypothetical protein